MIIIKDEKDITLSNEWTVKSKGEAVHSGRRYQVMEYEREFSSLERVARGFLGVLVVVATLGFALLAKRVRDLFTQAKESKRFGIEIQSDVSKPGINYKNPALADDGERQKASRSLAQRYAAMDTKTIQWMGTVMGRIPANFGFWMPGLALVASHLCEKKNIKGFYVCETMGSFYKKLKEVTASDQDQRCAFVVAKTYPELGPIPQHKFCICFEKRAGKVRVAILDSQAHLNGDIPPLASNLRRVLPEGSEVRYANMEREVWYGCSIFALRDGFTFLRDPSFFESIKCQGEELIVALPPDYIAGTQSMKRIGQYLAENPVLGNSPLLNKTKGLSEYLEKYRINGQNHTITRKMYKYMEIALIALENLSQDALLTTRDKTFIAAA